MVSLVAQVCRGLVAMTALTFTCLARAEAEPLLEGPERMHLNRTTAAELLFDERTRENLAQLSWRVNVGTLQSIPNGRGLAYSAPAKQFPQVAIIGAYDPLTKTTTVHVIRLFGAPTIEVDSEPNVSITVEIAGVSFGPERTNSSGNALVPVEVPPGVDTAVTFAKDSHGNVTRDELPLNPPRFPRLLALCADGESALYVIEVNRQGELAESATFSVYSDHFTSSAPTRVRPGVFRVEFTPTSLNDRTHQGEIRAVADGIDSRCTLNTTQPAVPNAYQLDGRVVPIDVDRTWRLGVNLGWLTNGYRISGPFTSLRVSYAFSGVADGLRAELETGYTKTTALVRTTNEQTLDLDVQTWPIFASARYVVDWGAVRPSAALNAGAAISQTEVSGDMVLTTEAFATPWLGAAVGGSWLLGDHELSAELGYAFAKRSGGSVAGNVGGLRFMVGYNYSL